MQRHRLRCRGCPPGRERLQHPRLRRRLPQTPDADKGSHAHDDEPFAVRHPTARLPAWSPAPGAPNTSWPVAEDIVRSPDVSSLKSALYDGLRSADGFHVLTVDGTMKNREDRHGCPPARRGDALDPWRLTAGPRGPCTSVLTTRTLQGLGLCRRPQRQQTPCCRVRPGERGAPRRSGGCALGSRGQRLTGVARRPVVVVSTFSGRRAGHVPPPDDGLASRFSGLQDAPSVRKFNVYFNLVCPDVDALEPFRGERNRQFTSVKEFFHDRLYRASLSREQIDATVTSMKSAEVWSGLAKWIWALAAVATLYSEEMKNKHSKKGKSRLRLLVAAATFQRYQWYLNNARLRSTVACQQAALLGTETCGDEAVHAELRGVFRQAYKVSVPEA